MEVLKCGAGKGLENISCTVNVKDEVTNRVKEEKNILNTVKQRKANKIDQTLGRNFLVQYFVEGKVEVNRRRRRRRRQLLNDRKEKRR